MYWLGRLSDRKLVWPTQELAELMPPLQRSGPCGDVFWMVEVIDIEKGQVTELPTRSRLPNQRLTISKSLGISRAGRDLGTWHRDRGETWDPPPRKHLAFVILSTNYT